VTKFTFHKYSASGSLQHHDAQCVLPISIINKKIYVFLWFWFIILSALTLLDLLHHVGLVLFPSVRSMILRWKLRTASAYKEVAMAIDTGLILQQIS
jgi:hypothetical protein